MYLTAAALLFILVIVVILYNRMVRHRNLVDEAWSGIDVQLKRRRDLVPNLVETVKGYARHERTVFEDVTRLRSRLSEQTVTIQEKGQLESSFTQALKSLFALAEAYPDLKANQNFIELQKSLAGTEEQIQLARRYYNGAARDYNILVQSFPSNIVAALFRFAKVEFFEIELATERAVPAVSFS